MDNVPRDSRFLVTFNRAADGGIPSTADVVASVARLLGTPPAGDTLDAMPHSADTATVTYEVYFRNVNDAAAFRADLRSNSTAVADAMGAATVTPLASASDAPATTGEPAAERDTNIVVYCVIGALAAVGVAVFAGIQIRNMRGRRGAGAGHWGSDAHSARELQDRHVQLEEQLYDQDDMDADGAGAGDRRPPTGPRTAAEA